MYLLYGKQKYFILSNSVYQSIPVLTPKLQDFSPSKKADIAWPKKNHNKNV